MRRQVHQCTVSTLNCKNYKQFKQLINIYAPYTFIYIFFEQLIELFRNSNFTDKRHDLSAFGWIYSFCIQHIMHIIRWPINYRILSYLKVGWMYRNRFIYIMRFRPKGEKHFFLVPSCLLWRGAGGGCGRRMEDIRWFVVARTASATATDAV